MVAATRRGTRCGTPRARRQRSSNPSSKPLVLRANPHQIVATMLVVSAEKALAIHIAKIRKTRAILCRCIAPTRSTCVLAVSYLDGESVVHGVVAVDAIPTAIAVCAGTATLGSYAVKITSITPSSLGQGPKMADRTAASEAERA